MNKSDLVNAIAESTGLTKVHSAKALDAVLDAMIAGIKKGELRLVGIGTFKKVHRAKTEGRNPRTGAKIAIPASNQVKFKPGKLLKDAVN